MSERRLGRGLEALLGPISREEAVRDGELRHLAVEQIRPNPYQPRQSFDDDALGELADSIQSSGMLQPVVVRQTSSGFQLIAGERRWRAVQRLGWRQVPAVVREVDDQTLLTLALIENLQRDDLNAIDEARGYQRLIDEFKLAPLDVAKLVGRDRSTVSNTLRLLGLPEEVQGQIASGTLSPGHARALLALPAPDAMVRLGRQAVAQGWSVRETEAQVRNGSPRTRRRGTTGPQPASVEARRIEEALRRRLGTDVRLTAKRRGRGLLSISYYSNDDLARVLELILGQPFEG